MAAPWENRCRCNIMNVLLKVNQEINGYIGIAETSSMCCFSSIMESADTLQLQQASWTKQRQIEHQRVTAKEVSPLVP